MIEFVLIAYNSPKDNYLKCAITRRSSQSRGVTHRRSMARQYPPWPEYHIQYALTVAVAGPPIKEPSRQINPTNQRPPLTNRCLNSLLIFHSEEIYRPLNETHTSPPTARRLLLSEESEPFSEKWPADVSILGFWFVNCPYQLLRLNLFVLHKH